MKRCVVLYIMAFACFTETSFAQMKVIASPGEKESLLQMPMVHIAPVSSRFVPVHIDVVKPFVVSLNPIVFDRRENAACARFKKIKSTLVLQAERTTDVITKLQWETKYAFYATGFEIERSFEDSLHFSTVNFAAASEGGSFRKNYHLPDHNNHTGVSFYRIKQHNGDTGLVYSNIVSIKGYEAIPLKIYPSPASDWVWIDVTPKQSGKLTIMVYDPAGKLVQQQSVPCTENMKITQSINTNKLAAGVYRLKIVMPGKNFVTGKFIKA